MVKNCKFKEMKHVFIFFCFDAVQYEICKGRRFINNSSSFYSWYFCGGNSCNCKKKKKLHN